MSSISVPGFESSAVFTQISAGLEAMPAEERKKQVATAKAIFQFDLSANGKQQTWFLDFKVSSLIQEVHSNSWK